MLERLQSADFDDAQISQFACSTWGSQLSVLRQVELCKVDQRRIGTVQGQRAKSHERHIHKFVVHRDQMEAFEYLCGAAFE